MPVYKCIIYHLAFGFVPFLFVLLIESLCLEFVEKFSIRLYY